jgi:hypothetical protein
MPELFESSTTCSVFGLVVRRGDGDARREYAGREVVDWPGRREAVLSWRKGYAGEEDINVVVDIQESESAPSRLLHSL